MGDTELRAGDSVSRVAFQRQIGITWRLCLQSTAESDAAATKSAPASAVVSAGMASGTNSASSTTGTTGPDIQERRVTLTCIVGIADNGKVYIGGDSAGVSGLDLTVRSDEKVFKNDEFLFGFTSSFRMGQLLRFSFSPPDRAEKMDDYKYLVTTFMNAVRQCLKDGGYARTKEGEEQGGTFLLGYRGRLYCVHEDYQVGSTVDGFASCGCGDQIANGSLFSTVGKPASERIDTALKAAERFSAGVRGPFTILEI